jgi:alkanesulfonate monooxygenase SsuD/methylene tetrahydromethanopterin reductase-like flavin-dependent oxidoreductase (luciferase family)
MVRLGSPRTEGHESQLLNRSQSDARADNSVEREETESQSYLGRSPGDMRFSLFTEIQCPAGLSPEVRLNEFLEQAELADRLGFHGFWIAEIHCQPRFSLLSAPYVVLGAAAQRTRRLRLGVAVNTLPVHHPVILAEQAAMLDLLSGGRMDFAAGGGHPHSRAYECFGADHRLTHDIMAEGLEIICKAWSEDTLTFNGKFFQIP